MVELRIKKTMASIWTICFLVTPTCLLLSLIQIKYAHAEGEKILVTYTENNTIRLEKTRIPIPDSTIGIGVSVKHAILSSADPNWNNARYFYVSIQKLNEEHGNIPDEKDELEYLQKIEYIPSHACSTVNLHDRYYCIRNDILEAVWPISARGKSK